MGRTGWTDSDGQSRLSTPIRKVKITRDERKQIRTRQPVHRTVRRDRARMNVRVSLQTTSQCGCSMFHRPRETHSLSLHSEFTRDTCRSHHYSPAFLRGSLELHTRAQLGSSHSQLRTNEFQPSRTVDSTEQAIWILGSLGLGPSPSWRQMSGPRSGHGCQPGDLGQRELLAIKPDTPIPTYPSTSMYTHSLLACFHSLSCNEALWICTVSTHVHLRHNGARS